MRKRFVVWAAAFTLLLAGCAAGSDGAPQDTGTVTADPVVVRYGISNAWDALMPYNSVSGSNYARIIYDKIYDRLAYVHADGTLSPRAARSWKSVDDGYGIEFALDERFSFHDGTPVTAQNWVETFRLMTDPDCPMLGRDNFSVLAGTDENGYALSEHSVAAEAVDAYTLKLTFKTVSYTHLTLPTTSRV